MGANHGVVEDQKGRVAYRGEISSEIQAKVRAPDDCATRIIDLSKQGIRNDVACSHVDCGVPTDVAAAEGVFDRETESAAGRNVISGHVHCGNSADCAADRI